MKLKVILTSLILLLSVTSVCSSQENYSNDSTVNWDTIGMALLKGLEYKELYFNEVLYTKVLKYEIDLHKVKYSNILLTVDRLAVKLSEQPAFISSHDWKITILISTLTAILTVITTVQLVK